MAAPKITGTLGPILKPTRIRFDPVRGLSMDLDWESAGSGIVGLASAFMNSGTAFSAEVSPRRSHISAELTAGTNGFPDRVQDHWQLQANEIQEDIKLHPAFVALGDTEGDKILAQVDSKIADRTYTPDFTGISSLGQQFYFILVHGQTHWAFGQYVFRWTTYVSFNSTAFRNEGGRETILTTSQLLSEANPPAGISDAITSIPVPSVPANFLWGWRRVPSTRTTQAGNRIEIATEYWLASYPTCVYSPA